MDHGARRVGILGGTFDPIHRGHVDIGDAAQAALGLTELHVVTSHVPPHRPPPDTSSYHRFAMVALTAAERPAWRASDLELRHEAPSYTSRTLHKFHDRGYEPTQLHFVIGADAFAEIQTWFRWQDVVREVEFIVVTRPGHQYVSPPGARVHRLETVALPVSSSEIRAALGRGETPAELPKAVAEYIRANGLYAT